MFIQLRKTLKQVGKKKRRARLLIVMMDIQIYKYDERTTTTTVTTVVATTYKDILKVQSSFQQTIGDSMHVQCVNEYYLYVDVI